MSNQLYIRNFYVDLGVPDLESYRFQVKVETSVEDDEIDDPS